VALRATAQGNKWCVNCEGATVMLWPFLLVSEMAEPRLEEVFKLSGVPTYTFVEPIEYPKLLVALRTPGRGVVIEGPSGIGKTTAVLKALGELGVEAKALKLSARKRDDRDLIAELPNTASAGLVIIDDFHRLEPGTQKAIADHLKVLADEERLDTKLIIVGINKVGDSLVSFAPDLNNRIDTIRFEANPDERVNRLVERGEVALNVSIGIKSDIVRAASGSFYVAQMLCHETCIAEKVTERQPEQRASEVSFQVVVYRVMATLSRAFMQPAIMFAAGPRLRREGRAPYLHILKWLAEADEWSIILTREVAKHPEQRGSTGQVVEKGYLRDFLENKPELGRIIHFQQSTSILTVEDPQFVFFLRNLGWNKFAEQVGFLNIKFSARYDFALSFAGAERQYARRLFDLLSEDELEVFFDENEQSRILAENVEDYLGPIYSSEASYVVCLLSPDYPKRVWTTFESEQFRSRFGQRAVIPIWYSTAPPGAFDESSRVGGITFDPTHDQEDQLVKIAALLREKIKERSVAAGAEEETSSDGAADPLLPLVEGE
jgi:hypothetical protein